jgi:tetratricopeptide (TPR) repeat protein
VRQRLAQLFDVPTDLDYVEAFQALAQLTLELRRNGPSVELLLRRGQLERGVGNHESSLRSAQQAVALDPANPEGPYEVGLAYFYLALAKAHALPVAPRAHGSQLPAEGVAELLGLAIEAFSRTFELNPNDEDAAQDLAALAAVLALESDGDRLAQALRRR